MQEVVSEVFAVGGRLWVCEAGAAALCLRTITEVFFSNTLNLSV